MKKLIVLAVAMMIIATAGMGMAATQDVQVSAQVTGNCKFVSTAPVAFGILDQTLATPATATGNVVFWCTANVAAYVLGDETNPGVADGSFSGVMTDGGVNTIPYTLAYTNFTGAGLGPLTNITSTITGTIANADYINAAVGNYTDVVTFTLTP